MHWSKDKTSFGYNIPEDFKTDTLEDVQDELAAAGLEIQRGDTQVIITQDETTDYSDVQGRMVKFPNGDIQVSTRQTRKRSSDQGKTWRKVTSQFDGNTCQFPDGEIMQFTCLDDQDNQYKAVYEKSSKKGLTQGTGWILRSKDNGLTETRHKATIYLPEKMTVGVLHRVGIVRLDEKTLLGITHAQFEDDPRATFETWVTKEGKVAPHSFRKSRVIALRSTDHGQTWYYLSTVAFDLTNHTRTRILGYCEPKVLPLPSGRLLCFMRTVAGGGIRPLYMSMSENGGQTWSTADPVADRGVSPQACRMDNGIIVANYGRPGNWLMFSVDEGQTWFGNFQFYMGPKGYDSWNQCMLEEVAPDKLLIVYGRTDPDNRKRGEIAGTFFTVRRIK